MFGKCSSLYPPPHQTHLSSLNRMEKFKMIYLWQLATLSPTGAMSAVGGPGASGASPPPPKKRTIFWTKYGQECVIVMLQISKFPRTPLEHIIASYAVYKILQKSALPVCQFLDPPLIIGARTTSNQQWVSVPIKHETLAQRWFPVGPSSTTLAQQQTNVGPTSHIYCVCCLPG